MTANEVLDEIQPLGTEGYRKILRNHGVPDPCFGVKIEDLKKIQSRVKKDYQLALDLYDTGIYDAMYLAGLIADDQKMTKKDLQRWVENATSEALCSYTVPWVATEGRFGWELGLKWIESKKPSVAAAGWSTLVGLVAMKDDSELDLAALKKLLQRVEASVHEAPNLVRYAMVMFVIALGTYVKPLADLALKAAEKIGRVEVDVGKTACKIPFAPDYIRKIRQRGAVGKKRKTVKC